MGLWDLLFGKPEPPKQKPVSHPSATPTEESVSRTTVSQPTVLHRSTLKSDEKKVPLKVTNHTRIVRGIQLKEKPEDIKLTFYCPVQPARIYCHSILIDKLGDLTKFIVFSIYEGHSIEEIMEIGRASCRERV